MHSGNDDAPFLAHDGSKRFGAARNSFVRLIGAGQNRIIAFYGRGKNYQLGLTRVFRAMLLLKLQAKTF